MIEIMRFPNQRNQGQSAEAEKEPADEILEDGWQDRLGFAIDQDRTAAEELKDFTRLIRSAERENKGVLIMDGQHRDSILIAQAVKEYLASKGVKRGRDISYAGQSIDNVITAAYGISALTDPKHGIGHTVGYATGQGKELNPGARIVSSTAGSMARLLLNGKLSAENVGAVIVDGGDNNSVYNQLLLSALKDQHDKGIAPLTVILSRRLNKAEGIAKFFGVRRASSHVKYEETDYGNDRYVLDFPLPADIRYEEAKEPFHIKQAARCAEILKAIIQQEIHPNANTMVFAKDDEMVSNILWQIDAKLEHRLTHGQGSHSLELKNHMLHIISDKMPLKDRLALELGFRDPKLFFMKRKPHIIISTQPAEMLGVVQKFNVVIDTHRSKERGGYYSISRDEADRRASFAREDGVCYRLTTEIEGKDPQHLETESQSEEFSLTEAEEAKFDADLRAAGKDPESFPVIAPRLEDAFRFRRRVVSGEIDPAIEKWTQALNVETHIAKLVESFDKKGERDLGLALAACVRESRILPNNDNWWAVNEYMKHRDLPPSDLILRLSALADYIKPEDERLTKNPQEYRHEKIVFNQQSLSHMKAMLDRWGIALGKKVELNNLVSMIRGLDNEKLTEMVLEAMPEKLAFYNHSYYTDNEFEYVDKCQNQYINMRPGRSAQFLHQSCLLVVIGTAGKTDDFITASHPVTVEQALRLMPDRVKIEYDEPFFDKKSGTAMQQNKLMVLEKYETGSRVREEWTVVREEVKEVEGEAGRHILDAEQRRQEAVERLKIETEEKLRLPLAMLGSIIARLTNGAVLTSAQDRLAVLRTIQKQLADDQVNDPQETEEIINNHIEKLDILAKKAAKEAGWSPEWYPEVRQALQDMPAALAGHEFAQELIEAGTSEAEIMQRFYDYVLAEGMDIAQQGEKLNLDKIINIVLDSLES